MAEDVSVVARQGVQFDTPNPFRADVQSVEQEQPKSGNIEATMREDDDMEETQVSASSGESIPETGYPAHSDVGGVGKYEASDDSKFVAPS